MHPLNGALPGLYVTVRVTRGALASLQNLTVAYRRTFVTLSVSLWNDLADPVFDGVAPLVFFKRRANAFLLA